MHKNQKDQYNVIDLFAGAGGLSLGATRAGFNVFCAIELDKKAIDTHRRNFPKSLHLNIDLSQKNNDFIKSSISNTEITGIIGGPPCQGFSTIGHGKVDDARNTLFIRFFEIVKEFQPSFFIAENVPGILSSKYEHIRQEALQLVSNYEFLEPILVNASEYGAPTTRTRVFFIGYNGKNLKSITEEDFSLIRQHTEKINVKEALTGLPLDISNLTDGKGVVDSEKLEKLKTTKPYFYSRITGEMNEIGDTEVIKKYITEQIVTGCFPTRHSEAVMKRYLDLSVGKQDKISKSVKLDPNGLCPTIRAGTGPDKGSFQAVRPIHYCESRVITPREAARLQGFPDWFCFQPTIWHSFRQIGNSVSPIVAEKILSLIYQKLT
jgi:DNA (cytosine-5)-methyltransferase 1